MFLEGVQKYRGGGGGRGQGPLDKIQTETDFFVGWLLLENLGGLQLNRTPCISEHVNFWVCSAACCEIQIPLRQCEGGGFSCIGMKCSVLKMNEEMLQR